MDTKKIAVIPVDGKTFEERKDLELKKLISQSNENFNQNYAAFFQDFQTKFQNKEWIYLNRAGQSEGVYYVHDIAGLMPDLDVHYCNTGYAYHHINPDFIKPQSLKFAGFQGVIPSENEARNLFNNQVNYFRTSNGGIKVRNNYYPGLTIENGTRYMFTRGHTYSIKNYNGYDQEYFWVIPIYKFNLSNPSVQKVIWTWFEYDLTPKNFPSKNSEQFFSDLKNFKEYLKIKGDKITFDEEKIYDAVKAGKKFSFLKFDAIKEKNVNDRQAEDIFREELLTCDFRRVGLDRYDEKLLTDPNRGHWDLWEMTDQTPHGVKLSEPIYARNPAADVNASGIVAIDFGTKSTVVVYENERGQIFPLQVGAGTYSKGVQTANYENPTIIEFRHIEKFLAAYTARAGRPKTSLENVTVSHMAQENLSNTSDSSLFASFFENLKQWCGNLQYKTRIRDHDGTEKELPSFLNIAKDEFNPLEYYAYFLGSYINHMFNPNHIFLKYILSFPVMYERNIRERMLEAFRAGILKSLPTALLDNQEVMQNFQMVEGTSEPAAYAITALEGYGFLNGEDDNDIYYSVFDFGGGTTDFDFGVLKLAQDDDADFYDFVLTHFGAHGDRTLGGENLLRLLAFQIFKANSDKLLKPRPENPNVKIPFTWAAEKMEFAGSEGLIRASQEANLNMHNLVEALRPIWEAPNSEAAKKIFDAGKISLTVFDDAGQEITGFELSIGVQNVLEEIKPSPTNEAQPEKIPFKVSDSKFNSVVVDAWKKSLFALSQLEAWASQGHKQSIEKLEAMSLDGMAPAKAILARLAESKKNSAPAPAPAPAPKKVAPLVDLGKILTDRISRGIDSFFISLRDAFNKVSGGEDNGVAALSDVNEIAIFLAGNSTKSALVKKLFEKYTDAQTGKARKLLGFGEGQNMPRFVLYPPLGTEEADKIQAEKGVAVNENKFERPTGKTGVAFGLLRCREGSAIRVIDISPEGKDKKQVPFQFYVGRQRMGKFKILIDKSTKLGKWYKFIGAKLGVFDLLYTDESLAATNNAPASIAKRLTIHFDADPEANVYVKAVESNKICYAVTKGEPTDEIEGKLITLE